MQSIHKIEYITVIQINPFRYFGYMVDFMFKEVIRLCYTYLNTDNYSYIV